MGVSTLLQHEFHQRRGAGGSSGVWGTAKEGGERRVVDDDAGMGGPVCNRGGGLTKIRWTWERSQVERWDRWTIHSSQHWSRATVADHGEI